MKIIRLLDPEETYMGTGSIRTRDQVINLIEVHRLQQNHYRYGYKHDCCIGSLFVVYLLDDEVY